MKVALPWFASVLAASLLSASSAPTSTAFAASLTQISVGADGAAWGIDNAGQIFTFNTQTLNWQQVPGALSQIAVGANAAVWGLNAYGDIYHFDPDTSNWDYIPGTLTRISVGADGDVWGLNGANGIYHFQAATQSWQQIPGGLAQVAVGFDGAVWGINTSQQIFRFNPGTQRFEWVPGALSQMAVGADGEVWGINSGGNIYHFNTLLQDWEQIPGTLAQISVGSATNVWGINAFGSVYTFDVQSQRWQQVSGGASQISAGANGTVWSTNGATEVFNFTQPIEQLERFDPVSGTLVTTAVASDGIIWGLNSSNQIYNFNKLTQTWTWIPGDLVRIAVARDGRAWGINAGEQVYGFDSSTGTWVWRNGQLSQVAVADNGDVWGINSSNSIYRYDAPSQSWVQVAGELAQIVLSDNGDVWGINSSGSVYQFDAQAQYWVQMPGTFSQIAAGSSSNVWALNSAGQLYRFDPSSQSWIRIPGTLAHISVGFDGAVWGVASNGSIFQFDPQSQRLNTVPGTLSQIAIGADAVAWGINPTQSVFQFEFAEPLPPGTVDIYPGIDIPSIVAANPPGTTYIIYPGLYRLSGPIYALTGDRFIGQTPCAPPATSCPAVLSGSREIGSLAIFDGTNYEVTGQIQQGTVTVPSTDCEPGWEGCIYPEDLFFDGVPLQHVNSASLPILSTGQWWFDYANYVIYFQDNPAGHLVETSVVPNAIGGSGNNVTIDQLTIEECASPIGSPGAIGMPGDASLTEGTNWTIQNSEILLNHGSGIRIAFGMQVVNDYIHNNGDLGIGGGLGTNFATQSASSGIVISDNLITNNNYAHVQPGFQSGGIKITGATGVVVRGNTITNNDGGGIHFDINSQAPLVDGNMVANNTGADGISYEISLISAIVRNNILLSNGANLATESSFNAGLSSVDSAGMNAYCNVIDIPSAPNANGALVIASDRGNNFFPPGQYLSSAGNWFHHNTVIWQAGANGITGYMQGDALNQPDFFANNTPPDYNTYHLPSLAAPNFVYDNDNSGQNLRKTFAEYEQTGADVHGSADTNYMSGYPLVAITSPQDQSTLGTSTIVTATASDPSGISMVEFYVDWNLQATSTSRPYVFNWSNAAPGTHTVAAMAYSNAGIRSCYAVTLNTD